MTSGSLENTMLSRLKILNLGPIVEDEVEMEGFTYFVGRNNAGKSHYLKAIELLFAQKAPSEDEMRRLQNNKSKPIRIEASVEDVGRFTQLLLKSNHKKATEERLQSGGLRVVRQFDPDDKSSTFLAVVNPRDGSESNPCGTLSNLLKILPEPIPIVATADTVEEMKAKRGTAIDKLKKEVMVQFFRDLRGKTTEALRSLDEYLHSDEQGARAEELREFEEDLKRELTGEFQDVIPSVRFDLPDEEVIAKEMRIFLDDGYRSELDQKGHGLQRATLLALLRVLARRGQRYQDRPAPIFLIGEIETFLHPYAQRQLAQALSDLVDRYQIVTTTHSPFMIVPEHLRGYRRVVKSTSGANSVGADWQNLDERVVQHHLDWRQNLEGLFADRVILVEGKNDDGFYERARQLMGLDYPEGKFTVFVSAQGKKQLSHLRRFYIGMGLDDVSLIGDLDYLFCRDGKTLLGDLGLDEGLIDGLLSRIQWTGERDPKLSQVLEAIEDLGEIPFVELDTLIEELKEHRVFILKDGSPENYYSSGNGARRGWLSLENLDQLQKVTYLEGLLGEILQN